MLERLILLRNEVDYLKTERDSLRSFQQYMENVRLKRAVERSLLILTPSRRRSQRIWRLADKEDGLLDLPERTSSLYQETFRV